MKESYSKDLVNHTGPESWRYACEGMLQALTGEDAGCVTEPRKSGNVWRADLLEIWGRQYRTGRKDEEPSGLCAVGERGMQGSLLSGNRESRGPAAQSSVVRTANPRSNAVMNGPRQSDRSVVPKKAANKGGAAALLAESLEERDLPKGNPHEQTNRRAQDRKRLQQAQARIRRMAQYVRTFIPKGRARCGNPACRELCGGSPVTGIPTATRFGANSSENRLYLSPKSQRILHHPLNSVCAKAVKYAGWRNPTTD